MREQIPSILRRFTAGDRYLSNGYESGRILPMKTLPLPASASAALPIGISVSLSTASSVFFSFTLLTFLKEVRQRDEPSSETGTDPGRQAIPI